MLVFLQDGDIAVVRLHTDKVGRISYNDKMS